MAFSELLSQFFAYFFVISGVFYLLLSRRNLVFDRSLRFTALFVLIIPLLQYAQTGNYAGKWILNFFGFVFAIISVTTMIAHMNADSFDKLDVYLRRTIFVLVSIYLLIPVFDYGLFDIFINDRNYLYSSPNSLMPPRFLEKQKISALISLYIVIVWRMVCDSKSFHIKLSLSLMLLIAINMLLGSRSQTIGMIVALLLITAGNKPRRIALYAATVTLLFVFTLYLMTTDVFTQLAAIDLRVMLFHSAATLFFNNLIGGIGLFYLPQFLEANSNLFVFEYSYLFPLAYGNLKSFPTGFESSFMQFAVELGTLSLPILYIATKRVLGLYSDISERYKYFVFFLIVYLFSSITEDNLTQPAIYIIIAIMLGIRVREGRRSNAECVLMPVSNLEQSRINISVKTLQ